MVPAKDYLATFASDRSHMIKDGNWIMPPPAYPPICTAIFKHNLNDFINMTSENVPGKILNCANFIAQFSNGPI